MHSFLLIPLIHSSAIANSHKVAGEKESAAKNKNKNKNKNKIKKIK
jgi:hypothetical protein